MRTQSATASHDGDTGHVQVLLGGALLPKRNAVADGEVPPPAGVRCPAGTRSSEDDRGRTSGPGLDARRQEGAGAGRWPRGGGSVHICEDAQHSGPLLSNSVNGPADMATRYVAASCFGNWFFLAAN
jgi:hypothetical protein